MAGALLLAHPAPASAAPPTAYDQDVWTTINTPVDLFLYADDEDADALTYEVLTQPVHGALTGCPDACSYAPDTDYIGNDAFTFRAHDGTSPSNVATMRLTVYDPDGPTSYENFAQTSPGG